MEIEQTYNADGKGVFVDGFGFIPWADVSDLLVVPVPSANGEYLILVKGDGESLSQFFDSGTAEPVARVWARLKAEAETM